MPGYGARVRRQPVNMGRMARHGPAWREASAASD